MVFRGLSFDGHQVDFVDDVVAEAAVLVQKCDQCALPPHPCRSLSLSVESTNELPCLPSRPSLLITIVVPRSAVVKVLQKCIKDRDKEALATAIAEAKEIPEFADPALEEAQALLARLEEEEKAMEQLKAAIESHTSTALKEAVDVAEKLGDDFKPEELGKAKGAMAQIENEEAILLKIDAATEERDLEKVEAVVAEAEALPGFQHEKITAAKELMDRLKLEVRSLLYMHMLAFSPCSLSFHQFAGAHIAPLLVLFILLSVVLCVRARGRLYRKS